MSTKKRILSGMRPTGALHLGNLHGALNNWKNIQDEFDCFFFVADWHALTSDYADSSNIFTFTRELILDWLSVGLSPEQSTIFVQSDVKEHAELFLLLTMITPVPWLERNPTYKEQIEQLSNKDLSTFGFLGYPVLQAADIIMYKAQGVPVGIDQVPHVEITREIARRFNHIFSPVFPEPEAILTPTPKILGLDRRKMSKSYNNAIFLADNPKIINEKVARMITDPQRKRKNDPGDPDVCNVFDFHKLYSDNTIISKIDSECRKAEIGCVNCKKIMAKNLISFLEPIHEKRNYYMSKPDEIEDVIISGGQKAGIIAKDTMEQVRDAIMKKK